MLLHVVAYPLVPITNITSECEVGHGHVSTIFPFGVFISSKISLEGASF